MDPQQEQQNEIEAADAATTGQIAEPQEQSAGEGDDPAAGEIMWVTLANAQVTAAQAEALVALSQGASLAEAAVAGGMDRGTPSGRRPGPQSKSLK